MDFEFSPKVTTAQANLKAFLEEHVNPYEAEHDEYVSDQNNLWTQWPRMEGLKARAREAGLWNFFLPPEYGEFSAGFHNVEFAPLAEIMGRIPWSFEIFNCSAPDRGNMEVLARFGTPEQQDRWLRPLLEGQIRSCYAMTEPQVASSDATNISLRIERDGGHYVLNGRKWYASNIFHPLCEVLLVMGVSNPDGLRHQRHSTIFVPKDTTGLEIIRPMKAFGEWDSPSGHGELEFHDVRVPIENIILGEGRGFEIAQGRLGPGRFQYAMTNVGMAQRCLELMCARAEERVAFGQKLSDQSSVRQDIARSRCEIEQVRLLVFKAAAEMDRSGAKGARDFISMVKIAGPKLAQDVAERAIQIFGAKGVGQDTPLPGMWALARIMRIADGPDAVHMSQLAKLTIRQLATPVPLNS